MKRLVLAVAVAASVNAAATASAGPNGNARQSADETPTLVLVGPVEAVNSALGLATVLGQKVVTNAASSLIVGDTVYVIGNLRSDGILSTAIRDAGLYVPGATQVLLTGVVQRVNSAV